MFLILKFLYFPDVETDEDPIKPIMEVFPTYEAESLEFGYSNNKFVSIGQCRTV